MFQEIEYVCDNNLVVCYPPESQYEDTYPVLDDSFMPFAKRGSLIFLDRKEPKLGDMVLINQSGQTTLLPFSKKLAGKSIRVLTIHSF